MPNTSREMTCKSYLDCANAEACLDGQCAPCPTDGSSACRCGAQINCAGCSASLDSCAACMTGYEQPGCRKPICPLGCNQRQFCAAPGKCAYCEYLTPGEMCLCGGRQNCADCKPGNAEQGCFSCIPGFRLNDGNCVACTVPNCLECTETYCKKCADGFRAQNGACVQCPPTLTNCGTCSEDGLQCHRCKRGYTGAQCASCATGFRNIALPEQPAICEACPINCANCDADISACTKCAQGFTQRDGMCQSAQLSAFSAYWIVFCLMIAIFISVVVFYVVRLGRKAQVQQPPVDGVEVAK